MFRKIGLWSEADKSGIAAVARDGCRHRIVSVGPVAGPGISRESIDQARCPFGVRRVDTAPM
jgi:hypothetical protein